MDGTGVCVLEVIGDVVEREVDTSAHVEVDGDGCRVGADNAPEVAVEDPEVVPVVEAEHPVADAVPALVDDGDEGTKRAARLEQCVCSIVEVGNVAVVHRSHDGVATVGVQLQPVECHLVAQHIAVVGDRDSSVPVESTDRELGESLAERVGDESFLGVALSSVLGQLDDRDPVGERGEEATCLDRRELLRVPDEDHLAAVGG